MSCPSCGNAAAECIVHPNYWHCPSRGCRNRVEPKVPRGAGPIPPVPHAEVLCNIPYVVEGGMFVLPGTYSGHWVVRGPGGLFRAGYNAAARFPLISNGLRLVRVHHTADLTEYTLEGP